VSFVIFDIQALWCSGLVECQRAQMSKITNDC